MHRAGLYAIVHVLSGRRYVGQTNSFERRWKQHRDALVGGVHHNPRLQTVWDSDGELAFEFVELEVAPAHLQPVQLQKWLHKREHELIRTYKAKGLAFNIVDAELVETRAALSAANTPQASVSSHIHRKLQELKLQVAAAETIVRMHAKAMTKAESQLLDATGRQNKTIGFLRGIFGRADRPEDLENARLVALATTTVDEAASELAKSHSALAALLELRKDLHNSYPENVRRAAIRRRSRSMF